MVLLIFFYFVICVIFFKDRTDMLYNLRFILKMAIPIALSYIAVGLMNVVDALIVGNYDTKQLAYLGIANTVFVILYCIPMAMLQGSLIHSSKHFGAKEFKLCGKTYIFSVRYLWFLAIIFTLVGLCGKYIYNWLDQEADVCENASKLLALYALSIPAVLYYANANYFLQSIKRPLVGTIGFVIGNVLNLIINPVLTYGWLGLPEMGATGCVLTTFIIRLVMALYIAYYIRLIKKHKKAGSHFGFDCKLENWWQYGKDIRRTGYGLALIVAATDGSFTIINIFAGWLGVDALASYTIIANISVLLFMIFFAISQATTIVVAHTFGEKRYNKLKFATLSGYIVYAIVAAILFGSFGVFAEQVFGLFSDDENIIAAAESIILFIILDLIIDTLPINIEASLRGINDIKYLTINQIIAFLFARLSACYILAFVCGWGLKGLILGLAGGGICSALLNGPRLIYDYKKLNRS